MLLVQYAYYVILIEANFLLSVIFVSRLISRHSSDVNAVNACKQSTLQLYCTVVCFPRVGHDAFDCTIDSRSLSKVCFSLTSQVLYFQCKLLINLLYFLPRGNLVYQLSVKFTLSNSVLNLQYLYCINALMFEV